MGISAANPYFVNGKPITISGPWDGTADPLLFPRVARKLDVIVRDTRNRCRSWRYSCEIEIRSLDKTEKAVPRFAFVASFRTPIGRRGRCRTRPASHSFS